MIGRMLKDMYRPYDRVGSGGFATVRRSRHLCYKVWEWAQVETIIAVKRCAILAPSAPAVEFRPAELAERADQPPTRHQARLPGLDGSALLAIFTAALLGMALWVLGMRLLSDSENLVDWLIAPALWGVSGLALIVPITLTWRWPIKQQGEGRLMGWLLALNIAAVGLSFLTVVIMAVVAYIGSLGAGGLPWWIHLFYLVPIVMLLGLTVWLFLRGFGRAAPVGHHPEVWAVISGWFSGHFGTLITFPLSAVAAAPVAPSGSELESMGENALFALPLVMLLVLVSLEFLLHLRLRDWMILTALTLMGSLLTILLTLVLRIDARVEPVSFWLLIVSAVATAVGFTAGVAVTRMDGIESVS